MSEEIRAAVDTASDWVRAHPDEARYTDSLATAKLGTGLRVTVVGPNGESIETDMPPAVGGEGSTVSPGWLYRASIAACVLSLATMRAAQVGVVPFRCEVDVDSVSDDRGILGLDPDVPAGPLSVRIAIRMSGDAATPERLDEIARWAVDHCPVSEGIGRTIPVQVEVQAG